MLHRKPRKNISFPVTSPHGTGRLREISTRYGWAWNGKLQTRGFTGTTTSSFQPIRLRVLSSSANQRSCLLGLTNQSACWTGRSRQNWSGMLQRQAALAVTVMELPVELYQCYSQWFKDQSCFFCTNSYHSEWLICYNNINDFCKHKHFRDWFNPLKLVNIFLIW